MAKYRQSAIGYLSSPAYCLIDTFDKDGFAQLRVADSILVSPVKNQLIYPGYFWGCRPHDSDDNFAISMIHRDHFVFAGNFNAVDCYIYLQSEAKKVTISS